MKTIWKFPLDVGDNLLEVPGNPQWLDVQVQDNVIMVWAVVDTAQPMKGHRIDIHGTGTAQAPSREEGTYLGTVQRNVCVWHVFHMWRG